VSRPAQPPSPRDRGVSLVEVLVAMGLFGILGTLLLGLALSTSRTSEDTQSLTRLNEESRLAMERMTRELRQASEVVAAQFAPPAATTALTFWTDFDGDGAVDTTAADPEVLTYRWNPASDRLTLTANDAAGTSITRPVLAANVSSFELELRSSSWEYDADGDGTTTWQELDAAAFPGTVAGTPDAQELQLVDSVALSMTVLDGERAQTYRTQVDLRNQ
jgi:prepilin-type N-terminal cleavage/methylation domain-containing protein